MNNVEINIAAVQLLQQWDPFHIGIGQYDTEAADVVAALQGIEDCNVLAKTIQTVYEYSFEKEIPLEQCIQIAIQLLALKVNIQCTL